MTVSRLIAKAGELLDQHRQLRANVAEQRHQLRRTSVDTQWRGMRLWAVQSTLPPDIIVERRCPSCASEAHILEHTSRRAVIVFYRCHRCSYIWGRNTVTGELSR